MHTPSQRSINPVLFILTGAILIWAAAQRYCMPAPPFAHPDSMGFLKPPLNYLANGDLSLGFSSFPYPLWVFAHIKIVGTLNSLPAFQHIIGLITGLLWMSSWLLITRHERSRSKDLIRYAVGLAILALYLSAQATKYYEHYIGPESLASFGIAFILWALVNLWSKNTLPRMRTPLFACIAIANVLLYLTLPKWGLSLPLTLGLAVLALSISQTIKKSLFKGITFVILGAILTGLIWIPNSKLLERSQDRMKYYPLLALLYFNADSVEEIWKADLALGEQSPYSATLLNPLLDQIQKSETEGHTLQSMGFDPDFLIHGDARFITEKHFKNDIQSIKTFYTHYTQRVLKEKPHQVIAKAINQLRWFYGSLWDLYPTQFKPRWNTEGRLYSNTHDVTLEIHPFEKELPFFNTYLNELRVRGVEAIPDYQFKGPDSRDKLDGPSIYQPYDLRILNKIYPVLSGTFPWFLASYLLLLAFGIFNSIRNRKLSEVDQLGLLVLLPLLLGLGMNTSIALFSHWNLYAIENFS